MQGIRKSAGGARDGIDVLEGVTEFLDRLFARLGEAGLAVSDCELDHVCYRVASLDEYESRKSLFSEIGELISEALVGGRPIATYRLENPIRYRDRLIPLVELPSPKAGADYASGWEHAEFVIAESFDDFMRKYPRVSFDTKSLSKPVNPEIRVSFGDISVKFHRQSLADVIAEESRPRVEKIVSGGQTGADRAALDFARKNGIAHGGWCPKGRLSEDGRIPDCYELQETAARDYAARTEKNVIDSDATVIFSLNPRLEGGSRHTCAMAKKHGKPCLHITPTLHCSEAGELREFLLRHDVRVLNVAGPRASKEPGVAEFVTSVLERALRAL